MDPVTALAAALSGAAAGRVAYNEWVENGGFPVSVKVRPHTDTWMRGVRSIEVHAVGVSYVYGVHVLSEAKVKLPFAAVEVA